MKSLATPLLSFVLAGLGVLMAWAWYLGYEWVLIVVGAFAIIVFLAFTAMAWSRLPRDPVGAVWWFERRIVAVAGITATLGSIAIIAGIQFVIPDPPDGAPDAEFQKAIKTVAAAGLSAVIAFITAFGMKAESFDDSVGETVSSAFEAKYVAVDSGDPAEQGGKITLPEGTNGWKAVFSPWHAEGWGKAVRRKRAADLKKYLADSGLNDS